MITEDYCSYELSKLLKEKGFDVSWCDRGWDISCYDVKQSRMFSHGYDNKDNWIEQPTLSLAMKWLREKGYHIVVFTDSPKYEVKIQDLNDGSFNVSDITHTYGTYEEAVEAALKYCLTNLINNETN